MEKYFIVSESQLCNLLADEMERYMCQLDGVDNWSWYGAGYQQTMRAFYPKDDWDQLSEDDIINLDFHDIAQMRIDTGEFMEYGKN